MKTFKIFDIIRYALGVVIISLAAACSLYSWTHSGWEFVFSADDLKRMTPISDGFYQLDLSPLAPLSPGLSLTAVDSLFLRHAIRSRSDVELREKSLLLNDAGIVNKKGRNLTFAASDGSDPRINGNIYTLRIFPANYTKYLLWATGLSTLLLIPASLYKWLFALFVFRYKRTHDTIDVDAKCRVYIIIFLLMLVVPLVFVNPQGGMSSRMENRILAKRPAVSLLFQQPKEFVRGVEAWISDNIGFRDFMLRMHAGINKLILDGYYTDGTGLVLVGRNEHHFHVGMDRAILSVYQGKPWLSDMQLRQLSVKLDEFKSLFDRRGIHFVVMFCTDKESVYPEYYPDFIMRSPKPSSLDMVNQYILGNADVDFFCIKERLLAEKDDYLLYPKTGDVYELLHYNETGAFFAYQELMGHIAAYFPDVSPFSVNDVAITYRHNGSSSVTLKHEPSYHQARSRFFDDAIEFVNDNQKLPVCLLLRDSYADWFTNYMPQHFSRTIMHHWDTVERLEEYLDSYKPDIVVFEVAERAIPYFTEAIIKSLSQ